MSVLVIEHDIEKKKDPPTVLLQTGDVTWHPRKHKEVKCEDDLAYIRVSKDGWYEVRASTPLMVGLNGETVLPFFHFKKGDVLRYRILRPMSTRIMIRKIN